MTIYGRFEEQVSRCVKCDLAEPESLASLGGSAPGLVDGIRSSTSDGMCYESLNRGGGKCPTQKFMDNFSQTQM